MLTPPISPGKILIIRLTSIGDVILTTPVIKALKAGFPDAHIDFLVMDRYAEAISGNPYLDKVVLFDKEKYRGINGICRFGRNLNAEGYNLVVDLHAKIRSILISRCLHAKIIRYKKRSLWKSLGVHLRLMRYQVDDTIVRNYFKPLGQLGIQYTSEALDFHVTPDDMKKAAPYLNMIVFAPGAAQHTKQWPMEYFVELAGHFREKIVFIGGDDDGEAFDAINPEGKGNCINLAGKLSLKESGALIAGSKFVLTNDSAPFHMARAFNKRVFVFFGPTDPEMFEYDQNTNLLYTGEPCSPCSLHGDLRCPKGHFNCMKHMRPGWVYDQIKDAL
ncbi:MAG: glycosyltransferase family 9 protein [Desulfobacteraceae bacterium]|nr:glycosyltransferase family 9 protein [Desulfobacteraceae bacterium]